MFNQTKEEDLESQAYQFSIEEKLPNRRICPVGRNCCLFESNNGGQAQTKFARDIRKCIRNSHVLLHASGI